MKLTKRQLNRATLDRQLLLERADLSASDGLRQVLALQAQEPASPYLALWNRISSFDPNELDRAFHDRTIVKCSLMRVTLHAICRQDYHTLHAAMLPILRASRLNDKRFRSTGMTIEQADELISGLVHFASQPRSKAETLDHLASALGAEPPDHLWWAMRTYSPLVHAPTHDPWSFPRQPLFVAAPPGATVLTEPIEELVRRYLLAFGPATAPDIAQFSLHSVRSIRSALALMSDEVVEHEDIAGHLLFDMVDARLVPDADTPAPPRLLGMWDSLLLAHKDRSRVLPDAYRRDVIRRNGDTLPAVLVDGFVAGVWRPVEHGIEITAFERIGDSDMQDLHDEATDLRSFLADRDPTVYSRFGRWGKQLPTDHQTVIG